MKTDLKSEASMLAEKVSLENFSYLSNKLLKTNQ